MLGRYRHSCLETRQVGLCSWLSICGNEVGGTEYRPFSHGPSSHAHATMDPVTYLAFLDIPQLHNFQFWHLPIDAYSISSTGLISHGSYKSATSTCQVGLGTL